MKNNAECTNCGKHFHAISTQLKQKTICCSGINKLKGNATVNELNYFIEALRNNYTKIEVGSGKS